MTESATEGGAPAQALVIVDAQTGFLEGEKAVVEAAQLTTRLGDLLAKARQAGALVIHLQNDGAAGAVDEHGQPGWQLHLAPAEEEQVIRKCRDDGFADTKLSVVARVAEHALGDGIELAGTSAEVRFTSTG